MTGDPSLLRDILNLGVPGILLFFLLLLMTAKVIPEPTHKGIIEDRDKQIAELREEKKELNHAVRELGDEQVEAIRQLAESQKETLAEQRKTIDLLHELSKRNEGVR